MSVLERLELRLRFRIWARLRANRYPSFYLSHSQFGEDMVARALLEDCSRGVYVDVGAHHPIYYSNTYHFYCRGWHGLNIDATPGFRQLCDILRPRDINIEACVAAEAGKNVELFEFNQPALNTVHSSIAETSARRDGVQLLRRHPMRTVTLTSLLERYLSGCRIDLMTIDVEGLDTEILQAHDWDRWRPRVLIFERQGLSADEVGSDDLVRRIRQVGYELKGKCGPSLIMSL
jgi:FkbM family methyltransferase